MKTTPVIDSFVGRYYFLSNFYASPLLHQDILYPTVEHAYQSMKTKDLKRRFEISILRTPNDAKQAGQMVDLRKDWEDIKDKVMLHFVRRKFHIKALRHVLLLTEESELIEGNTWGDREWGVYKGEGKNKLGKILMKVRKECNNE